jgi:hypothetical protein
MSIEMGLKPAVSRKDGASSYILFGRLPAATLTFRGRPSDWLERWFPTRDAAKRYAFRRGWTVREDPQPIQD